MITFQSLLKKNSESRWKIASKNITINAIESVSVRRVLKDCKNFRIQNQLNGNEECLEDGEYS